MYRGMPEADSALSAPTYPARTRAVGHAADLGLECGDDGEGPGGALGDLLNHNLRRTR